MEEKKIVKDATLIFTVIVIGILLSSPGLKLIGTVATPITLWFISQSVTKELAEQERQSRDQRDKQDALKNYLTQMISLLVEQELSKKSFDEPITIAARALTLSVISELDEKRNRQLIEFLSNAQLFQYNSPSLLKGADFSECLFENCNFTAADLRYCNFSGAKLNKANFSRANLENTKFTNANLSAAILAKSICNSETSFKNAILDNVQLSEISELSNNNFEGASLNQVELACIKISNTELTAINQTHNSLKYVTFEKVILNKSDFSFTRMGRVQFINNTILESSNISNSSLYEVEFVGAKLDNTDFTNSSFDKVNFSNASLINANFKNAHFIQFVKLNNTNLEYANLENVDLSRAILDRTILKYSNLCGANLKNNNLASVELIGAIYTKNHPQIQDTIFPDNFDPQAAGMKQQS